MSAEKATAIVLRLHEFSETSLVCTLYTREHGRVRALAKGARRPKGPFESALDLLNTCRIVFLRKSAETLDLLTEAKLERRFRPAGGDPSRLYAAYYLAELLGEFHDDYEPDPGLFDVAAAALEALQSGSGTASAWVLRIELVALQSLGFTPSLDVCAECGSPTETHERAAFGLQSGGLLCRRCRPGKRHVASLSSLALSELRRAAAEPPLSTPAPLERRAAGELRGVMNQYVSHLLGKRPRVQRFLGPETAAPESP